MSAGEARRKVIRQWMALPKVKRQMAEQAAAFAKKAVEENELQRDITVLEPPRTANARQRASNEQTAFDTVERMLCTWAAEIPHDKIRDVKRRARDAVRRDARRRQGGSLGRHPPGYHPFSNGVVGAYRQRRAGWRAINLVDVAMPSSGRDVGRRRRLGRTIRGLT